MGGRACCSRGLHPVFVSTKTGVMWWELFIYEFDIVLWVDEDFDTLSEKLSIAGAASKNWHRSTAALTFTSRSFRDTIDESSLLNIRFHKICFYHISINISSIQNSSFDLFDSYLLLLISSIFSQYFLSCIFISYYYVQFNPYSALIKNNLSSFVLIILNEKYN